MNFELSEDHQAIKNGVLDFIKKEVLPHKPRIKKENKFPREFLQKMGQAGHFGCVFPEKYGGTQTGFMSQVIVAEEISREFILISSAFNMQCMSVPFTILNWGQDHQREKYVKDTIMCDKIGYFGLTEPNAGSDAAAIETTAVKEGDYYRLNGSKIWITLSPVSDYGLIFAKTNPADRYGGASCFIVDTKSQGVSIKTMDSKWLSGITPQGEIHLEDCLVPAENLLGNEGEGFAILSSALNYGRLCVAARSVAIGQACLDFAVKYSDQREQFGRKIGKFQMIQHQLADMAVEVDAARLLVYKNAWLKDKGHTAFRESGRSKYYAAEVAARAGFAAFQIHGAYGFSDEFEVGEYLLYGVGSVVAEGSTNIQRVIIAEDVMGWKDADRYAVFDRRYDLSFERYTG
ncbi:MAG: acyl-CoA dehydrogenase family protein [Pseudomonadota bacterium]